MTRATLVLLATTSALAFPSISWAQSEQPTPLTEGQEIATANDQRDAASVYSDDDIVVTGSRIDASGFNQPTPVTVVTAEQLNKAAPQGIAAGLNQLPQLLGSISPTSVAANNLATPRGNFLNLRNVGINRTLILMDGTRVPPTTETGLVDVDFIPELLVGRVDVVTGAVSAVYGSDAVTGVVNFILDKDFSGFKGLVQGGITSRGDGESYRIGGAYGTSFADDRAHFMVSLEQKETADILRTDRPLMKERWGANARFAAGQTKPDGTIAGAPGTENNPIAFEQNVVTSTFATNGLILGGPAELANRTHFDNDGRVIPFVRGIPFGANMIGGDGQIIPEDGSMTGESKVTHAFGRLSYEVAPQMEIYAEANYQKSRQIFMSSTDFTAMPIYSGNAFLDPAVQAILDDPLRNVGNLSTFICGAPGGLCLFKFPADDERLRPNQRLEVESYSGKVAVEGQISADWDYNFSYIYGRSTTDGRERSRSQQSLYAALDAVRDPSGNIVCRVTLVAPGALDNCVPYNPMVFGGHSQELVDFLMGASTFTTRNTTHNLALNFAGSLFDLPAGPVGVAFGGEYRHNSLNQTSNSSPDEPYDTTGLRGVLNAGLHYGSTSRAFATGSNNVKEANAEINVPIFSGKPFADSLSVTGAVRYTDYSTSGTVYTWKAGAVWDIVPGVRFRVTRSRDIRAPTLFDLFAGTTQTALGGFQDPHCGGCTTQGRSPFAFGGGNPDLKPEIGNTFSAGLVLAPENLVPGLRIAVDYYNLNITDAITNLSPLRIVEICEESGGTSPICDNIVRPLPYEDRTANNIPTSIFAGQINAAFLRTKGFDFETSYRTPEDWLGIDGRFTFRALGSYVLNFKTQQSASDPVIESAGFTLNAIPKFRGTVSANYDQGPFSIYSQVRIIGGLNTGPNQIFEVKSLPAVAYTDLTVSYDWDVMGGEVETFLSVTNLLDKSPPIFPSGVPGLFYPTIMSLYDVVGQSFTAGARIRF